MWIDAAVFECLDHLINLNLDGKTVAEFFDTEKGPAIEAGIAKALAAKKRYETADLGLPERDARTMWSFDIYRVMSSGESDMGIDDAHEKVGDAIVAGKSWDTLVAGYRRTYIFTLGVFLLRKYLVPQNGSQGPQWGGAGALVAFCETVLVQAKAQALAEQDAMV